MTQTTKTIRVGHRILDLKKPRVMAIINITPDSFYAGSRTKLIDDVLSKCEKHLDEGADILDFGAMSTRPGAKELSITEEIDRLIGPLMAVRANFPESIISVDTYRVDVLKACIDCRIDMVNDISAGLLDQGFMELVGKAGLAYVLMHMQGVPRTMQESIDYDDIILEMLTFFSKQVNRCKVSGIHDVIIDPGFGFGKLLNHNYEILKNLGAFQIFDCPIMVGLSRKSMIYKALKINADTALNGSTALHMISLLNGASILRVHDVKEAVECIELYQLYSDN